MQIHDIQRKTKNTSGKRVGRGGKRGKTAGRGHKGQKARAGHKIRPEVRDVIKRIPKLRGESASGTLNSRKAKPVAVNVSALETLFAKGDVVSPETLYGKGLPTRRGGRYLHVKILGTGDITQSLTVEKCSVSDTAREKIEKAGGTVNA